MKKVLIFSLSILFILLWQPLHANDISLVTGEIIPYSYKYKGMQAGVMSDIVVEISKRIGFTKLPASLPWARAVKYSLQDNTIIYPLARTSSREKQYHWIGPVVHDVLAFYVRGDDTRSFKSIEDFKDLKIGVIRGAPPGKKLTAMGFKKLQFVTAEENNALKLEKGRLDAWFATKLICEFTIRKTGINQNKFRLAFKDVPLDFYLGTSLNLKSEAKKWQNALDGMKKDGSYQKILIKNYVDQ